MDQERVAVAERNRWDSKIQTQKHRRVSSVDPCVESSFFSWGGGEISAFSGLLLLPTTVGSNKEEFLLRLCSLSEYGVYGQVGGGASS